MLPPSSRDNSFLLSWCRIHYSLNMRQSFPCRCHHTMLGLNPRALCGARQVLYRWGSYTQPLNLLLVPLVGKFVGFFLPSGLEGRDKDCPEYGNYFVFFFSKRDYRNRWASKSDPVTWECWILWVLNGGCWFYGNQWVFPVEFARRSHFVLVDGMGEGNRDGELCRPVFLNTLLSADTQGLGVHFSLWGKHNKGAFWFPRPQVSKTYPKIEYVCSHWD